MKSKPEISVVMSVYNGEDFLRESIGSILNQTFKNFEFIIINDGSRDSSLKIIEEYRSRDARIKKINNEKNIGLSASLNKGIKIAKGKYIARQDADDISRSDRLKKQYDFLENNKDMHLVGSNCRNIDINGEFIYEDKHYSKITDFFNVILNQKAIFPHGVGCMRTKTVRDIGGYNENFYYSQDGELWIRFIINKYKIVVLIESLYDFRITPEKNKQKIFGQREYNKIKRMIYQSHNKYGDKNKVEKKCSYLKKEIMSKDFRNNENYISQYWFSIARLSLREGSKKLYTWKSLFKSLFEQDDFENHLKKILWFLVPLFPYKFVMQFKGKLSFLK